MEQPIVDEEIIFREDEDYFIEDKEYYFADFIREMQASMLKPFENVSEARIACIRAARRVLRRVNGSEPFWIIKLSQDEPFAVVRKKQLSKLHVDKKMAYVGLNTAGEHIKREVNVFKFVEASTYVDVDTIDNAPFIGSRTNGIRPFSIFRGLAATSVIYLADEHDDPEYLDSEGQKNQTYSSMEVVRRSAVRGSDDCARMVEKFHLGLPRLNPSVSAAESLLIALQDVQEIIEPLLDHIREVWANNDEHNYRYIMNWLARPLYTLNETGKSERTNVALVIQGAPGCGKGTISRLMAQIYGQSSVAFDTLATAMHKFNAALEGKMLVVCHEATGYDSVRDWKGSFERLKSMVTDDTIMIERKGVDSRQDTNVANWLVNTNHDNVIPLSGTCDRRYALFACNNKYAERTPENLARNRRINGLVDNPFVRNCFFSYLVHLPQEFRDVDVSIIPSTTARTEAIDSSRSSTQQFVADLQSGYYVLPRSEYFSFPNCTTRYVKCETLYSSYRHFCETKGLTATPEGKFKKCKELNAFMPSSRHRHNGERFYARVYPLPLENDADLIDHDAVAQVPRGMPAVPLAK